MEDYGVSGKVKLNVAMIGSRGFDVRQSGLETHVRELAKTLTSRGHRVTVYGRYLDCFTRIPEHQLGNTDVEVKDGPCSRNKFTATTINTIWATIHALRSMRFQVLHYHGVGCVFAVLLAKRSKLPVVLTLHSTNWEEKKWARLSGWLIHRLECLAASAADAVVAVSRDIGTRTSNEYGVESHVISPGSGAYLQGYLGRDAEILQSMGLEKGRYILYVGRIVPHKGCHTILDAFTRAKLPMKLVFAGPVLDETYCDSLRSQATDGVVMTGIKGDDELGALYRSCWIFCAASTTEAYGIALTDALAHGVPCLVSDVPGGHRQLVSDLNSRFPAGDAGALSAKLQELYARTSELADDERDGAGAQWLQQHPEYTFETIADQVLEVYRIVMQNMAKR